MCDISKPKITVLVVVDQKTKKKNCFGQNLNICGWTSIIQAISKWLQAIMKNGKYVYHYSL